MARRKGSLNKKTLERMAFERRVRAEMEAERILREQEMKGKGKGKGNIPNNLNVSNFSNLNESNLNESNLNESNLNESNLNESNLNESNIPFFMTSNSSSSSNSNSNNSNPNVKKRGRPRKENKDDSKVSMKGDVKVLNEEAEKESRADSIAKINRVEKDMNPKSSESSGSLKSAENTTEENIKELSESKDKFEYESQAKELSEIILKWFIEKGVRFSNTEGKQVY